MLDLGRDESARVEFAAAPRDHNLCPKTATPPPETRPPETRYVETRTDHDRTGLWGLLGLAGLLGLGGLRRRDETVRAYTDPRERVRCKEHRRL